MLLACSKGVDMKTQHVISLLAAYVFLHWAIAKNKVPVALIPFAKGLENKDLTGLLATIS